jgi:16S rRNA (cytidine1402-2'-O)-methyltransferase
MIIHLFPCPITEGLIDQIPVSTIKKLQGTNVFVVERAKTARRFIKAINHPSPISELTIFELNKFHPEEGLIDFLEQKKTIDNVGVLSEAGCPGIADPGHRVVKWAHKNKIRVVPHIGPSSILLALMASGMNGQNFCFHGYLPNKNPALGKRLKEIEQDLNKNTQTQIFIEAPYRNKFILENICKILSKKTILGAAFDLGSETEEIIVQPLELWQKMTYDNFHKRPAVFLIGK